MVDQDLSAQQLETLRSDVCLIEACPGAGKTRAMVARFKQNADASDRGVALLSFTNAAIDEATFRCADRPELLKAPHFVGTFDTFLHRYIVTPAESARLGKLPSYLQSWDDLPAEMGKIRSEAGAGLSLSCFSHDHNGNIKLVRTRLPRKDKVYFESLSNDEVRESLIKRGIANITSYNKNGLYDSESARSKALELLNSGDASERLARLVNRFSEIIVDEFQDCASLEHELLTLLSKSGTHITVVADPDQAIFEFRQAEPQLYSEYRGRLNPETVVSLETNYRSSPVICSLVSSLRSISHADILPTLPKQADVPSCIYVLAGNLDQVRSRFLEIATYMKVPQGQRIALAHRRTDAKRLAAGGQIAPDSDALTSQLLVNLSVLRSTGTSLIRRKSLSDLERLILSVFDWQSDNQQYLDGAAKLEYLGKNRIWVKLLVGELLAATQFWSTADNCGQSIRNILATHLTGLVLGLKGNLGQKFKKPKDDLWKYWNSTNTGRDQIMDISWSTIHSSKGKEYDAVLLKVPDADVINNWLSNQDSQERRVFYVGTSRARTLLALAIAPNRLKSFEDTLTKKGIEYRAENLG